MFVNCIGDRTFGVLTKLDLMDKGTNAMDVRSLSLSLSLTHTHMHAQPHVVYVGKYTRHDQV
jgi:hypothetical protein